ncbi:MAG: class I SAM-dependent methyltransferase [Defluviitaleaceae bacterium]|nr:class I SAM-dependent methyltransferase [Defluviitaleaceae bacterium]
MDETITIIREFYNTAVEGEWNRIAGRPEFLLTCRMFGRYIAPGERVLDIGGGPGRYSLYLAGKGCDVTLFDLSPENVKFARERAAEAGLSIAAVAGDAREADKLVGGQFDHVLLMGPMYHLLREEERAAAVNAALKLLKPDGIIYVSFINMFAGIIYYMKCQPDLHSYPDDMPYFDSFLDNKSYAGPAFTQAYFAKQDEILPFMAQFPLEKLHLFGQECVTSPRESDIMSQSPETVELWLDICERIWEREDLLSWSEHLMYVGRKIR